MVFNIFLFVLFFQVSVLLSGSCSAVSRRSGAAARHFEPEVDSSSTGNFDLLQHNKHDGGDGSGKKPRNGQTGILSGRPLPIVCRGLRRSALSGAGPRAEEGRHQQVAGGDRQHAVCEVERRRSSDPQSVCELVSGSPGTCRGDHGDVRTPLWPREARRLSQDRFLLSSGQSHDRNHGRGCFVSAEQRHAGGYSNFLLERQSAN